VKAGLVLGIGNLLLGDDGLGSLFAAAFARHYHVGTDLDVLDGGTVGLDLLDTVANRGLLLVVDAAHAGGRPGDVVHLEGPNVPHAFKHKLSTHEIMLDELLAVATLLDRSPKTVVLCGIEPAALDPHVGLSAPVATALPELEALVLRELARFGYPCRPRLCGAGVERLRVSAGEQRSALALGRRRAQPRRLA
jgi:hydrogenase maturation protease